MNSLTAPEPCHPGLRAGLLAGGAPVMWERVFRDILPSIARNVPPDSRVLEVGYGDGILSCFLAGKLGWRITGLDIRPEAVESARQVAAAYGLDSRVDFRCVRAEDTRLQEGSYDAVFIKTVLYSAGSLAEYSQWLDWILGVLSPGGILVNFESGRANGLMQRYRRLRGRTYTDSCLYTGEIEALYDERLAILKRKYYGGFSQFFAPVPIAYRLASGIEESLKDRNANNCFIVSIMGRKKP